VLIQHDQGGHATKELKGTSGQAPATSRLSLRSLLQSAGNRGNHIETPNDRPPLHVADVVLTTKTTTIQRRKSVQIPEIGLTRLDDKRT
jgi:hypothetical protein